MRLDAAELLESVREAGLRVAPEAQPVFVDP
jgi:hypothetical protein